VPIKATFRVTAFIDPWGILPSLRPFWFAEALQNESTYNLFQPALIHFPKIKDLLQIKRVLSVFNNKAMMAY
jgi:hypothetical protein